MAAEDINAGGLRSDGTEGDLVEVTSDITDVDLAENAFIRLDGRRFTDAGGAGTVHHSGHRFGAGLTECSESCRS